MPATVGVIVRTIERQSRFFGEIVRWAVVTFLAVPILRFLVMAPPVGPLPAQVNFQANGLVLRGKVGVGEKLELTESFSLISKVCAGLSLAVRVQ